MEDRAGGQGCSHLALDQGSLMEKGTMSRNRRVCEVADKGKGCSTRGKGPLGGQMTVAVGTRVHLYQLRF